MASSGRLFVPPGILKCSELPLRLCLEGIRGIVSTEEDVSRWAARCCFFPSLACVCHHGFLLNNKSALPLKEQFSSLRAQHDECLVTDQAKLPSVLGRL